MQAECPGCHRSFEVEKDGDKLVFPPHVYDLTDERSRYCPVDKSTSENRNKKPAPAPAK